MSKSIILPDEVSDDEDIARNLIGGESKKSIRKLYTAAHQVKPSQFYDSRNPAELSVNRISTLSLEASHQLGIDLKDAINAKNSKPERYHGFAQLLVESCRKCGCDVVKDDYKGQKPYHANIVYPSKEKYENMEIANMLVLHSQLILYNT